MMVCKDLRLYLSTMSYRATIRKYFLVFYFQKRFFLIRAGKDEYFIALFGQFHSFSFSSKQEAVLFYFGLLKLPIHLGSLLE